MLFRSSWSPAAGLSATNISNPTANPTVTTTYTVTKTTTATGCSASASVVVTVNNTPPTVSAGNAFTKTCSTNPNGASIGEANVLGNTYSWSPAAGLSATNISNPTANPTVTTTYTVTKTTTATGCSASASVVVTVNNTLPSVNAGSYSDVCVDGSSVTLVGSPSGGTFSGTGVTGNSFSPSTAGAGTKTITYTYTANGNGCTNSATTTIVVNALPDVNAGLNDHLDCSTSTVVLHGSSSIANPSFAWTASNGGHISAKIGRAHV